jgi:hypothetical protein
LKAYTLGRQNLYSLAYERSGSVTVQLPTGLSSDSNRLYLYVQIFTDLGTVTFFELGVAVVVEINLEKAASLTSDLASGSSSLIASLKSSSDVSGTANQILAIASIVSQTADTVNHLRIAFMFES